MTTPQIIRHLHLPGTTPFSRGTAIQNVLVRQHLDYKAISSSLTYNHPLPPTPPPTIFSFSPTPVYTTGRRELGTLSETTIKTLNEPLEKINKGKGQTHTYDERPVVRETLRGGQITFHGPGQLVIYPILDLKTVKNEKWPKGLSVRCYVNVLEEATINTLKTFGIAGIRTENPGVWVDGEKKIAALGLHLRRNITNYGVGLNVWTDLRYFDRIVACGLEGKKTTCLAQELRKGLGPNEAIEVPKNRMATDAKPEPQQLEVSEEMDLVKVSNIWATHFVDLVWGNEGTHTQQTQSTQKAVTSFLDNGEGRWQERQQDLNDELSLQQELERCQTEETKQENVGWRWQQDAKEWRVDTKDEK